MSETQERFVSRLGRAMAILPLLLVTLALFSCGRAAPVDRASQRTTIDDGTANNGETADNGVEPVATTVEQTTIPSGPPRTSCESVVHIGDSTSLGLTSPVYLPDPTHRIDAQYMRVGATEVRPEISGARSIIEHLAGQENAADVAKRIKNEGYEGCWVFALGTTDAANMAVGSNYDQTERIKRMMGAVGDDPVLWVNVKTIETSGAWRNEVMQKWNEGLESAVETYPNIHIYDWASVVQDAWFTDDRIHYTSAGYVERSRLIADALAELIPAGK